MIFFQFKPFFFGKTQFENSIFLYNIIGHSFFFSLYFLTLYYEKIEREEKGTTFLTFLLNFQTEFSQRKKA
jgi:hypothetical protein